MYNILSRLLTKLNNTNSDYQSVTLYFVNIIRNAIITRY